MPSKSSVGFCLAREGGIRKFFTPLFLGLFAGLVSASATFAAPAGHFRGSAYGTFADSQAGPVASSLGRSAFLPCSCEGTDGETKSNRVDSISAGEGGGVLTADETETTARTASTAATSIVRMTSRVKGLNALDGLITAAAVTAVSKTNIDANAIEGSTAESGFGNLRIGGKNFGAKVSPNTRVSLPGVGFAILNKVTKNGNGRSSGATIVHMIEINVTKENSFSLPVGTQIVIGHAASGFSRKQIPIVVGGAAWAAEGKSDLDTQSKNEIGRAAFVSLPCNGTGDGTNENTTSALSAGSAFSLGSAHTSAFGGPTDAGTKARTMASVDNVRLLDGLIVAGNVTAVAQETIAQSGRRTRSAQGSGFSALRVLGTPVPGSVPPNMKMQLPGFGYVVLNEQIIPKDSSDNSTRVNGMRVVITSSNPLSLVVGSQIIVAHAGASAKKFEPGGTNQVVASGQ